MTALSLEPLGGTMPFPCAPASPPRRAWTTLRRRLFARLAARFSRRQIADLTWRFAQCVAFSWHNEFLEIESEPV